MAKKRGPVAEYFFQLAVALDRMVNAASGGSSDETLSSRAHRMSENGSRGWTVFAAVIDSVFFWQIQHCRQSWQNEARRRNPAAEHRSNTVRK